MAIALPDPWPAAAEAARVHAVTDFPRESVGIILKDGEYVPLTNVAGDPKQAFDVSEDELGQYRDDVAALVHSHPLEPHEVDFKDGPLMRGPSREDMETQEAWSIPFGLIAVVNGTAHGPAWWGPGVRAPLLGRPFIFGIYDCFALLRDWYAVEWDVDLPDIPRDFSDIENNVDLYMPNMRKWGFDLADHDNPEVGDVLLWRAASPVVNHAGIYLGDGLMMHHLRGGLSARQPVAIWRPHMTLACVARYVGKAEK